MEYLRYQKYKNKQLENYFKPISISIWINLKKK